MSGVNYMPKLPLGCGASNYQPRDIDEKFPIEMAVMDGSEAFLYHWHEAVEILLGLEGKTVVGIRNGGVTLSPGKILIISSKESHSILPGNRNAKRLAINFSVTLLRDERLNSEELAEAFSRIEGFSDSWSTADVEIIWGCAFKIWQEYMERQAGWREMCLAALLDIAICAYRSIPKRMMTANEETGMLRETLAYLSAHYLEDISLDSCAKELCFNRTYLSHQFKKETGVSFHRYVVNMRLRRAEKLLKSTDMPVTMVSRESGFQSEKSFYRVFRERYGVSPGAYRIKVRSSDS